MSWSQAGVPGWRRTWKERPEVFDAFLPSSLQDDALQSAWCLAVLAAAAAAVVVVDVTLTRREMAWGQMKGAPQWLRSKRRLSERSCRVLRRKVLQNSATHWTRLQISLCMHLYMCVCMYLYVYNIELLKCTVYMMMLMMIMKVERHLVLQWMRTRCFLPRTLWYCENEKVFCDEGEGGVVFPQGYDADTRPLTVWMAVAAMPCEQCPSTREASVPAAKWGLEILSAAAA